MTNKGRPTVGGLPAKAYLQRIEVTMATRRTTLTVTFSRERETPNTIRFSEDVKKGIRPFIGTLYLLKSECEAIGDPDKLSVTVKAV